MEKNNKILIVVVIVLLAAIGLIGGIILQNYLSSVKITAIANNTTVNNTNSNGSDSENLILFRFK